MTRRGRIGAALVVVAILAIAWRGRDTVSPTADRRRASRSLDVAAFKRTLAIARDKAETLRRQTAARRHYEPPQTVGMLGRILTTPECLIGPGELCAALADTLAECDAGDSESCLATGQYLQDTPPRSLLAVSTFAYACKQGNADACARRRALDGPPPANCDDDPLACAWYAFRTDDAAIADAACSAGVADSCASMLDEVDDPADDRAYLESACQLGNAMACGALGHRLSPSCKQDCYPADEAQARAAAEIACAAGFSAACT